MTEKQITERDQQQLRRENQLDKRRQVRFSSGEGYITIFIVLVIGGILLAFAAQYVRSARQAIVQSNAHSLYLAIAAAGILDQPTDEDLRFFQAKYLDYRPVEDLLDPVCQMEQSVAARLSNSAYAIQEIEGGDTTADATLPITGYMKLEWEGQNFRVYLSQKPDGDNAAVYPQISAEGAADG